MSEDPIDDKILKTLSTGPKNWGEMEKELVKQGVPRQTFGRHLRKLRDIDMRIRPTLSWQPGETPIIMYELVPEGLASDPIEQTKGAISRLYGVLERYPTVHELALEISAIPTDAEGLAYKTSKETGWRRPTETEINISRVALGEMLLLAARIKANPEDDLTRLYSYTHEDVERAGYYLATYPELLPTLTENKFGIKEWPEVAKRYLGGPYDPIDRSRPIVLSKRT